MGMTYEQFLNMEFSDCRQPMNRPPWDDFFLSMCLLVAQRSPDYNTKHGAVCVDEQHRVLSVGYNGFPRGKYDEFLPNVRSDNAVTKLDFIDHAEENCLDNITNPSLLTNATMYVSGLSCNKCIRAIARKGIKKVKYIEGRGYRGQDDYNVREVREILLAHTGLVLIPIKPNFDWVNIDIFKV